MQVQQLLDRLTILRPAEGAFFVIRYNASRQQLPEIRQKIEAIFQESFNSDQEAKEILDKLESTILIVKTPAGLEKAYCKARRDLYKLYKAMNGGTL